ncbi:DUF6053 domain-containing protein [Lysobacter enzymogenes]
MGGPSGPMLLFQIAAD